MKYRLNKLAEKTTNNFKINDLEIDLDVPEYTGYNEISIQGNVYNLEIDRKLQTKKILTKIGLETKKYMEVIITVPKGVKVDTPILIDYIFKDDDSFFDKLTISYEEDSKCEFVITYISGDETKHFHHLFEETKSKKNSEGSITYINLLNNNSTNMIAIENDVYENAHILHNIIDIGGSTRIYNVYSNLLEEKSKNELNTIYIGQKNDIIDMNYYLNNIAKETVNKMQVEGTLDGECKKNFRGIIDFKKGCENSIGEENENCVLLSDTCRSRSLPELLCGEENVVGSHGVSSGKVSQEKLFYLMSRGYDKKEAERLIVLGNFSRIINTISSDDIKEFIHSNIEELLSE